MTRGNQTIDDGVHHIAMSGEKFAAGGGNFDADLVVRRNEGAPGAGEIGLAGYSEDEAVDHAADDRRIGSGLNGRGGEVGGGDQRLRGGYLGPGRGGEKKKNVGGKP